MLEAMASKTLPCDFIKTGLHHRRFSRNVPILCWVMNRFIKKVLGPASNTSLFI